MKVLANKVHTQRMTVLLADKVHEQELQRKWLYISHSRPYLSSNK